MNLVTLERLHELLSYDSETGIFKWNVSRKNTVTAGTIAGYLHIIKGYWYIQIDGKRYLAHRLAWLYVYKKWPENQIDHINGIKHDNRISNLRDVTHSENGMNKPKNSNNTSGHKGVFWHKHANKWYVSIMENKNKHHIGYYDDIEDAVIAYQKAALLYHGEFSKIV